ncbi:hypothetical protein ALO93_200241 [Pseudomonas amygdali pv. sesami]|nr:hypothetical protein ALO93_200241 [Pseudomonas amygdali pv. sesami]
MEDRTEAGRQGDLFRLHRQFSDHLPAADGQEDRGIAEYVRGCSRVWTRFAESRRGLRRDGTRQTTHQCINMAT